MSNISNSTFRPGIVGHNDTTSRQSLVSHQRAPDARASMAPSGSVFAGSQVSASSGSGVGQAPSSRSFSLGRFLKESAPVQKGAQAVQAMATRFNHNGIASVAGGLRTGALENARLEQSTLREDLSAPDSNKPSILDRSVDVKDRDGVKVSDLMEDLRVGRLGGDKRISKGEMMRYVAMGERICDAVKNSADGRPPLQTSVNGKTVTIPSNIDTSRAVAWYMQAKGFADNADSSRDPVTTGKSGSMQVKDPGNKLYNFLSAAPSAYGRTSTHVKAQSEHAAVKTLGFKGGFAETGIISATVARGGAIQRGIEDYSSKFPGGGGTMLFDKMKPNSGGDSVLFLKLEPVGTPTSFSFFGRHVDPAEGFARQVGGLAKVAGRNIEHGIHLIGSGLAKEFSSEADYRGEKMSKGPTKEVYSQFKEALEGASFLNEGEKKDLQNLVSKNGVTGFMAAVDTLQERVDSTTKGKEKLDDDGEIPVSPQMKPFLEAKATLLGIVQGMGGDLGLDRLGNEVHVTY